MLVSDKAQLTAHLEHHAPRLREQRLGEILLQRQLITPDQLRAALRTQQQVPTRRLGEVLIGLGAINSQQLREVIAEQLNIAEVKLDSFDFDPSQLRSLPEQVAR